MIIRLIYILYIVSFCSCSTTKILSEEKSSSFIAIVGTTALDCGKSRLLTLHNVDGIPFSQPVYEINLPDSFRIEGLKILIEWRTPSPNEMMKCNTLGSGYDQIYITNVKRNE